MINETCNSSHTVSESSSRTFTPPTSDTYGIKERNDDINIMRNTHVLQCTNTDHFRDIIPVWWRRYSTTFSYLTALITFIVFIAYGVSLETNILSTSTEITRIGQHIWVWCWAIHWHHSLQSAKRLYNVTKELIVVFSCFPWRWLSYRDVVWPMAANSFDRRLYVQIDVCTYVCTAVQHNYVARGSRCCTSSCRDIINGCIICSVMVINDIFNSWDCIMRLLWDGTASVSLTDVSDASTLFILMMWCANYCHIDRIALAGKPLILQPSSVMASVTDISDGGVAGDAY